MANFKFDTGFMGMAQTWSPTNNINPLPAWEFMNQTGTLGTFLAGSVVYVGTTGKVKVIVAGTVGAQNTVALLEITSGGTGYSNGTNVATTGGNGSGLTVNTTTTGNVITSIAIGNSAGEGYKINDVLTVSGGGGNATIKVLDVISLSPTASDAVEFVGAQAGSILPVLVDYVLVPSSGAATDLVVGR
tara:strand:+ start:212 stop:775 length:564 start_codon:yes stop_codon:yes gene_type:complete